MHENCGERHELSLSMTLQYRLESLRKNIIKFNDSKRLSSDYSSVGISQNIQPIEGTNIW